MDEKEKIFISHSSKDKVIADLFYDFLCNRWPEIKDNIYYSNKPQKNFTEDYIKECFESCRESTLGIIILSKASKRSQPVLQEIGCLVGYDIERYYIALTDKVNKPPGLEEIHRTFPFYRYSNQEEGFIEIAKEIEDKIFKRSLSKKNQMREEFRKLYMRGKYSDSLPSRDQCAVLRSLKCADNKIKIMGENSLQPIHGGFETLEKFLNDGGHLQVLLVDYDSEEHDRRAVIEKASISRRIHADWIATIANLFQLNQVKKGGKLEVKCTSEIQIGSLIIIDDWHLQFNQYKEVPLDKGKREHHSGVYLCINKNEGVDDFKAYKDIFDDRWKFSTSKLINLDDNNLMERVPKKFFKAC